MLTGDLFQPLTEKKKKPKPTKPEKWAYAKSEAKKKFDVYPSAYANAWAAKKYKELGGGWRMGEDTVEEAEDQKSDASERSINDQVYVNLMRKAQELPVTGLNRDERIKLALAKSVNKALDKTKELEKETDQLERELQDVESSADDAKSTTKVDVKQAPATKSDVQKTYNSVAKKVDQAITKTQDPKQRQELQGEAERIKQLVKTSDLSNKDIEKINKEVKAKERNGFTAQELKRVVDTVAQQAKQTKQEKTAQQQVQVTQKAVDPDVKKQLDTLNTVVADVVKPALDVQKQELAALDQEFETVTGDADERLERIEQYINQQAANQSQAQQAAESTNNLSERKKKKKKSKSKKAFGGYYFPGYHYYGQSTAEISDGGGDGGGESMFEVVTKNRSPEETGSLDSYYSRRRQPHKVVDGKRVELTDREEIQQYLDAYENETDRKDYGDMSEQRLYFRTIATLAESLEHDFGMQQDDRGWYLTPRSGRQRILDAERAFGTPQVK